MLESLDFNSFFIKIIVVAIIESFTKKTIVDATEDWTNTTIVVLGVITAMMISRLIKYWENYSNDMLFTTAVTIYFIRLIWLYSKQDRHLQKELEK